MIKPAHKSIVDFALKRGYAISVWDGEEYQVKKCKNRKGIIDAVESVDDSKINIWDTEKREKVGTAIIMLDCDPDERVADFTDYGFCAEWHDLYEFGKTFT